VAEAFEETVTQAAQSDAWIKFGLQTISEDSKVSLTTSCLMFIWIFWIVFRLPKLFSFLFALDLGMLHDVTMLGKRQEAEMQLSTGPPSFALCGGESYDKSQENCCGGLLGLVTCTLPTTSKSLPHHFHTSSSTCSNLTSKF